MPCCVDARGADPVPENDSDGEFIHLAARAPALTRPMPPGSARFWPNVRAAAGHIEALRDACRQPMRRYLYGLLPPSISHEGYSARAAYSYWDDFWALAGLGGCGLAGGRARRGRGRADARARARTNFAPTSSPRSSAARRRHRIAFIPGAADLGDFDATSTTVALSPAGLQRRLPPAALAATFERYWTEFVARRDGRRAWDAYTPYEWRNVGAFVRLGWRGRANALFDYFMADRRPAGWNQWAEVVGRKPREARFIGDMPHAWVASDYINALLDMLAYERAADRALVIAAGVPDAWLAGDGLRDLAAANSLRPAELFAARRRPDAAPRLAARRPRCRPAG